MAQACAVTTTGGATCWGYNSNGQLGNNSAISSSSPVNVSDMSGLPGFPAALTVTVTDASGSVSTPVTLARG
jgi:hypothetical protein